MSINDLRGRRINYDAATLDDAHTTNPFDLFGAWLGDATAAQDAGQLYEATTMTVATARELPDGSWQPATRVVLLKLWDRDGFVFFTNYDSDKGSDIAANPRASLHLHWPELQRQVRIDGTVEKISPEMSAEYFAMRPRGSQTSAWASQQSAPVSSRAELEDRQTRATEKFEGQEVPCPPNWGGYRVTPERIEFWQGRPSRLHDRIAFTTSDGHWQATRLCP